MKQKRFEEYFAKVVLESCFPERFNDLQVSDKPDLRSGKEIGIEVTNCTPKDVAEAFNLWQIVEKQGEQTPPRILKRLDQLKDIVHNEENGLIWEQGTYLDGDIDNSPLKGFVNAVANKVERLNSKNARYEEMDSYELFVNSAIYVYLPEQMHALLARTRELNNMPKKFDNIYLVTGNQKLLVFDIANNTFSVKHLYTHLTRMADKAIELYKEAKQCANLIR